MKHFNESEIIRFHEFTTTSGEMKKVPLAYPKLTESAVPRKFPNLTKYLSSDPPKTRPDAEKKWGKFVKTGRKSA